MNEGLKADKAAIRTFMRQHGSDARLAQVLDHARSGGLSYTSCCCFIGVVTAAHKLHAIYDFGGDDHYAEALWLEGANEAENAFCRFGRAAKANTVAVIDKTRDEARDAVRRRILIPMILAEIKRRQSVSVPTEELAVAR